MRKGKRICGLILSAALLLNAINITPVHAAGNEGLAQEQSSVSESNISGNEALDGERETGTVDGIDILTWDGVTTEAVYEAENFRVTFSLVSHWSTGYNAQVKIENTGESIIENWCLQWDFDNTISNIWNAQIQDQNDGRYIIKNNGWNQDVTVGNSVEFGISGDHAFRGFPKNYELIGTSTEVKAEDYTIEYRVESDWGTGFTGTISITNNTDTALEDWVLEFDFDREIEEIWNGVIERYENMHYIIRNVGYNSNILPKQSAIIGFKGVNGDISDAPRNINLYCIDANCMDNVDFGLNVEELDYMGSETCPFYILSHEKKRISGWAKNIVAVDKFYYTIEDQDNILCSGVINKSETWYADGIGFGSGYNLLTITAERNNEKRVNTYIIVNTNLDNLTNLGIDFTMDSDYDKIPDYFEEKLGLNPLINDSDGDGLDDYLEILIPNANPLSEDGDQDGILDRDEDYDGDGLSNYDEMYLYGTDLSISDTDSDGLNDKDEIVIYGTNPNREDTDGDGLNDFWEIKIGSDPLTREDSFTYMQTLSKGNGHTTNVSVTVENISADQVSTFDIRRVQSNQFLNEKIPGYIDSGYEFHINGSFKSATVEIDGEFEPNNSFEPALYYFNEETQQLEYVEGQTYIEGKVIASLEHFSKYILLNKTEYEKVWIYTFLYDENAEIYSGLDVVFVIDSSGSMSWNDSSNIRKSVTKEFIKKLTENDTAAVVSFNSYATILSDFTNDKDTLNSAVDKLGEWGGTSLSEGIKKAISLYEDNKDENRLRYIVMLTDGDGAYSSIYTTQAAKENIKIYTIGLGGSVSKNTLTNIANGTGGNYYHVDQAEELNYIFDAIAEKADYYKDTDGDGLSDYYEKEIDSGRLVLGTGVPISISYLNEDSDGDGLLDGEEIEIFHLDKYIYLKMHSNPYEKDTDGDGIIDNIDNLRLVPSGISDVPIYKSPNKEGISKDAESGEKTVSDDLTFNDYSYTQILKEIPVIGTVSGITPEFMMWAELTDLFLIGCATSDYNMSITLMDMLDQFKAGNDRNIGKKVESGNIFDPDKYNRYSNSTINERCKNYKEFSQYLNSVKDTLVNQLSINNGNILLLECDDDGNGIVGDMLEAKGSYCPIFSLSKDASLVLAIHNFHGYNISIHDYKCDGETFSGTINFHFYDHFGLDNDDNEWIPGFCDWFTLQHYDRFSGKHMPFITIVDISLDFEGEII